MQMHQNSVPPECLEKQWTIETKKMLALVHLFHAIFFMMANVTDDTFVSPFWLTWSICQWCLTSHASSLFRLCLFLNNRWKVWSENHFTFTWFNKDVGWLKGMCNTFEFHPTKFGHESNLIVISTISTNATMSENQNLSIPFYFHSLSLPHLLILA